MARISWPEFHGSSLVAQASWLKHRPIARQKKSRAQTMRALHKQKNGSPPGGGPPSFRIKI
jgi:hypothetical protein